jgi:putative RecB family exonuclease
MPIYSHSRLGTFETCPRQFWFAYIEKPEVERADTVEAFLGSRAHDALEELYRMLLQGRRPTREELRRFFDDTWARQWHDGVRIVKRGMKAADYREVGRKGIADYYDRYQPFSQDHTLVLERQVLLALDDAGRYRMQGYIDRLAQRPDGVYEIHDYKTAGYLMTQDAADADRQLALYQIGVEAMWNDVCQVDLVWHFLRFDKEMRSRRTPEQLEAVKAQCIATIQDIESRGTEVANFPTQATGLCDWCDYRNLCPATRHYVAVESLPPKQYKADAGVGLVDRWAALCEQRLALEARAEAIKAEEEAARQEVLAFADQQSLESVAGSSYHVDITSTVTLHYPRAGDEDRERFESALRKAGVWDGIVTVNGQRLKSLWLDEERLAPKARKFLKPFIEETVERQAKLKSGGGQEE